MRSLRNIRIRWKVSLGFGIVLAMLVLVGLTGIWSLWHGSSDFTRYRQIARESNQAGRVQANLLEARLAAKNFMISSSKESLATAFERLDATVALNGELGELVTLPERMAVVTSVGESLAAYKAGLKAMSEAQAAGDAVASGALEQAGTDMERDLGALIEASLAAGDETTALAAERSAHDLLAMRLGASTFVLRKDEAAYDAALAAGERLSERLQTLSGSLASPDAKAVAGQLVAAHQAYEAALGELHTTLAKRNTLIDGALDRIGPEIATAIEKLKLEIKTEQDELGPRATAAMWDALDFDAGASIVAIILGALAAWLIGNGIARPIVAITGAMTTLAAGDKSVDIPGRDHKDEIGDMAAAVQVFKECMIKAERLAAEQAAEQQLRLERAERIERLTKDFDSKASELLTTVASASAEMERTATSMSDTAHGTNQRALTVASAAEQASSNVQGVASATEELTVSIREISSQVMQSASVASRAVGEAERTNEQVQGLASAASRIGEVVELIADIAAQTNLLALNATIEAARAGEAGKGFAVVAAEVKELASQTAKATGDITAQINAVQGQTQDMVGAIAAISAVIEELNSISAGVSAAVEEQGAATGEIARNVDEASKVTQSVSENIAEVSQAAGDTGRAASEVNHAAASVSGYADMLRAQVEQFLGAVKAA